jgi:peptidoglycan/LPS O-acetylase OafA/YrhL
VPVQQQTNTRTHSTEVERFLWGLITGSVIGVAADLAWDRSATAGVVGYVVGVVAGVGLVTNAREGLNAGGLALGTVAGTAVGVLCLLAGDALAEDADGSSSWSQWVGTISFVVAVPLGASIGHARQGRPLPP